ncbi:hypothetical protein A3K48_02360 [candidate division WOR-1 bacterium RIFOXYA12_FULL_52_29]|uniref:Fluoride-specific ion channel FluC n=1 Tax=candidate division WOR-1 bacterium RIFOXYC12_FULL_54_18 TaxID=1802584 RepID=A0A1F4T6W6_UNCSA|nr:MAG: hypothetical protein A3K44_02360 [candidate division WOR-1 bacterium RIFOXYA2_FULL_51_19]OGC17416.1 MAG: hypothetical protein A3K48_02360 [candidate division WOR-1 bacterium RIFOXYA12_FULL_52_29]OGC26275.1 MAG: hypothetical protein A3K32_02355 [candidate division WOR-1 bacterium RIFOXYB2_FULL_45_9]OGC27833.1 MAG: hypothetical protein A3K49_02360 [candidate division WOR-1 bacterium RIFOXYC12_FULL_54_18]OGC29878.1 MAG: hypothetical protein A2346_03975 [candidate division WOR-1 bacterium R
MLAKFFYVAAGGVIGALARYILSAGTHKLYVGHFPLGTLLVNLSGSLVIGILWGIFDQYDLSHSWRLFFFIGILGSYTTFSSFGLDTFHLFRDGEMTLAIINILLNNILGIFLVFIGYGITRLAFRFI